MTQEITVPRLGWSMEEGTFVGWLKGEGEWVRRGDLLFELEGEKATQEIEAVDEGVLQLISGGPQPGEVLKVGTIIGYLVATIDERTASVPNAPDSSAPVQSSPVQISQDLTTAAPTTPATSLPPAASPSVRRLARTIGVELEYVQGTGRSGRILAEDVRRTQNKSFVETAASQTVFSADVSLGSTAHVRPISSPRARRVAVELGVDWRELRGTGSGGRIREQDVRAAAERKGANSPSQTQQDSLRIPHSAHRRVIAQRMTISRQQTVPVTITSRANATNLVNLRQQFKATLGDKNVPSYQDIITKLVGELLKQNLHVAGRWEADAMVLPGADRLHIGMAVDTAAGLLVPVIKDVGNTTITNLALRSRELIERARTGKLTAAEMQGGVFTITNLGSYGIDTFTPIIHYPEVAILGLGAIRREVVVFDSGAIGPQEQISLSLTFDHCALDGAPAARFLQALVAAIVNPSAWLLSAP